jgi:hypothetical protein
MIRIIDGKGRILISPLANGEVSISVDTGRGTMGCLLDKKRVIELRRALFECVYPKVD